MADFSNPRCGEAGDVGEVGKVDILGLVSVIDASLGAEILVLMRPIFIRFGEADRGKACSMEWRVVATPSKAVLAVNNFSAEAVEVAFCDIRYGARKRSAWRVGIEAGCPTTGCGNG